jgi:hypothetical protein
VSRIVHAARGNASSDLQHLPEGISMTLADQLWKTWSRLGPHWRPYFRLAGLDLYGASKSQFVKRLQEAIQVTYQLKGIEEFCRLGTRGVEPGDPARSLFYHVFASPHVTPDGIPDIHYPTMKELEIIENYIYSVSLPSIETLLGQAKGSKLAIVVFAYEYAPAPDTVHRCHADLVFSRTGISRVGNAKPHYVPKARGFFPDSGRRKVHVVPARFGAFIAVQRKGNEMTIGPLRFQPGDLKREFWVPLHKLFSGTECIAELDLKLSIETKHINQKIRKVHLALRAEGVDTGWTAAQIKRPPFVISNGLAEFDAASGLVVPIPHDPLVERARTADRRLVGFPVPRGHNALQGALWFAVDRNAQRSPEFVHAKHALVSDARKRKRIVYLPDTNPRNIDDVVREGGYEAANFIDWTADGWVRALCPALDSSISKQLTAFSIVAQPDFFPLVKQQDLMTWWEKSAPKAIKRRIWPDRGITASPLSSARLPANFTLSGGDFDSSDRTMAAIIGMDREPGPKGSWAVGAPHRETTLSYKATNLFQPGWDSAQDFGSDKKSSNGIYHLANYGLGSPYPEDTLICAAFGAFWPGAVPDVSRFFAPDSYPSTTPILDSQAEWDGNPLPTTKNNIARYKSFGYADYVRAISQGVFRYEEFANVTQEEYISRTAATARVFQFLGVSSPVARLKYPFLSFRHPTDEEMLLLGKFRWKTDPALTYRIEVARMIKKDKPKPSNPRVITVALKSCQVLYAAKSAIAHEDTRVSGKWHVRNF